MTITREERDSKENERIELTSSLIFAVVNVQRALYRLSLEIQDDVTEEHHKAVEEFARAIEAIEGGPFTSREIDKLKNVRIFTDSKSLKKSRLARFGSPFSVIEALRAWTAPEGSLTYYMAAVREDIVRIGMSSGTMTQLARGFTPQLESRLQLAHK